MVRCLLVLVLSCSVGVWAQNSNPSNSAPPNQQTNTAPSNPQTPNSVSPPSKPATPHTPDLSPPRSDSVNADSLSDAPGESSSRDDAIDLSPPANDTQAHPKSSKALHDEGSSGNGDVSEFHPWDPHKAAKDVEVGDFYFKRQNYRAAESRYREALYYKDNDADATFHLAVCLEKMDRPEEAIEEYESYLKILPHGRDAQKASKAIARLKGSSAEAKAAK